MIAWLLSLFKKKRRNTTPCSFETGALKDPEDTRDHLTSISQEELPKIVVLDGIGKPKQQGRANSCTAHAVVSVYEQELVLNKRDLVEGSEQYNYYQSRILNDLFPEDQGSYLRDAVKILRNNGCCPEKLMPYDDKDINYNPGIFCDSFAKFFKIKEYVRILSVPGMKKELANNHPIALSVPIYNDWFMSTGLINRPSGTSIGGHAVKVYGYNEYEQVFLFQNSWGSNWGIEGNGKLPFDYVYQAEWFDAWSLRI